MHTARMVTGRWTVPWDELAIARWAGELWRSLDAPSVSFATLFVTPQWFEVASDLLEVLRLHARIPLLLGCSSASLVDGSEELERANGFVLALHYFPGGIFHARHLAADQMHQASEPAEWHRLTGETPARLSGWLMLADPFTLEGDAWLRHWNAAYPGVATVGGLSGGFPGGTSSQLYLDGEVYDEGAVVLSVSGAVALEHLTSQGCTPFGDTWTVTRADRNFILSIGNRPAYQVLEETFNQLSSEEKKLAQNNLFVGFATNEYCEEFQRGDFLVRNLLGADPQNGVLAVQALPRAGQTIQFHRRDAASATDDLRALLLRTKTRLSGRLILGGCLCCCNGRGQSLFGVPHHDAAAVQDILGPLPLSGFYANGEVGPVGGQAFIHGYTASLALWVTQALE